MSELVIGRLQLRVSAEVAGAYPGYRAGVVVAENLANGPSDERSVRLLDEAARHWRMLARPADHPHIAAWRGAFGTFGAKPSRYPSSAEALMQRALRGDALPRINMLVDIYNAVSVRHVVPVGGEDLDTIAGPVVLAHATGAEPFDTREEPAGEVEHPRPGEVVWADDLGVTCRRWNWRQGRRTQLRLTTTAAYFLFDALGPCDEAQLSAAMHELAALLRDRCPGATLACGVLTPPSQRR